ncbi:MAG: 6-phosphogluconolactonase [Gammaproteobacteria bacterium]|jgi:6-phosphogluconolactonase
MNQQIRWHCFPDPDAVAGGLVRRIGAAARDAIEARGRFNLVLAGGSTPQMAYRRLAQADADWPHWHLYLGDERCLPPEHPDRNSVMITKAWLGRVSVPLEQIHWIGAEQGAETAAAGYEAVVRGGLPFDLVLLGMGEDGHTASLFPGREPVSDALVVPVHDAPKPPPERVSLSYGALSETRALLLAVTGASKRAAVEEWSRGASLPVSRLQCAGGIDVLLDEAAWGARC